MAEEINATKSVHRKRADEIRMNSIGFVTDLSPHLQSPAWPYPEGASYIRFRYYLRADKSKGRPYPEFVLSEWYKIIPDDVKKKLK